jgi:hypothetical protein
MPAALELATRSAIRAALLALAAAAGLTGAACSGDDASRADPDAAQPADAPDGPACGNGVVEAPEACDDGANDRFAGGCLPGCTGVDDSDAVFATPMHEIALALPPASWEALRHEIKSRHAIFGTGLDCRMHTFDSPYAWYAADVTIDGVTLPSVAVRKKGHLGSQSTLRPALKLDVDQLVDGRRFHALEGFSLDNNKQDPSLARTCTAYALMTAAGIPAPRCTHAHVVVNGADQGVYTLHEEIDHDFLARAFRDDDGNLYEGTANDFRPEFVGGFEQDTNREHPARLDLAAVMSALASPDAALPAALDDVVDLEAFYRFWAAETLVWHRDGYSGNANNFFLYADPSDRGRFRFLPWGVDGTFNGNSQAGVPDSVMAFSALTSRLYAIPAERARYHAALDDLLAHAWDPAALAAGVDAVGALADPLLSATARSERAAAATSVKAVIAGRADAIARARAAGDPAWTLPMRGLPCRIPSGSAHGTFATTWGTISQNAFTAGTGTFVLDITGAATVTATRTGARAGTTSGARVQVLGDAGNRRYTMTVPYPDTRWFDPFSVVGDYPLVQPPISVTIVESDLTSGAVVRRFELGEGTWTFTAASQTTGQAVTGSFTGMLFLVP